MENYRRAAVERAMKLQEVILRVVAKKISRGQVARLPFKRNPGSAAVLGFRRNPGRKAPAVADTSETADRSTTVGKEKRPSRATMRCAAHERNRYTSRQPLFSRHLGAEWTQKLKIQQIARNRFRSREVLLQKWIHLCSTRRANGSTRALMAMLFRCAVRWVVLSTQRFLPLSFCREHSSPHRVNGKSQFSKECRSAPGKNVSAYRTWIT
jgi:hypothetical protein